MFLCIFLFIFIPYKRPMAIAMLLHLSLQFWVRNLFLD